MRCGEQPSSCSSTAYSRQATHQPRAISGDLGRSRLISAHLGSSRAALERLLTQGTPPSPLPSSTKRDLCLATSAKVITPMGVSAGSWSSHAWQRSPELTRAHPRSPELTRAARTGRDHPRSRRSPKQLGLAEITRDQTRFSEQSLAARPRSVAQCLVPLAVV